HVQRPAEDAGFDDRAAHEATRQLLLAKPFEPRPEGDVRRRRVLGLEGHEPLDRLHDRETLPLEQKLSREERPVQLTQREGPHITTAALRRSGGGSANSDGRFSSSTRWVTSRSQG